MLKFDLPKHQSSIIKVLGIGGGGSNAVTHMFEQGITDVDFIICNTDAQALGTSSIPTKIQLGEKGLGAGSLPSVGKEAAKENIEDIKNLLDKNTNMLFITAGMGGGTGTGAAPVIAETAKELGILTVAIVTLPFSFEGRKRKQQAEQGIQELREHVDSLLIICNDKLREQYGDLKLSEAFGKADNILTTAAKGIAEIITVPGYINVDFEDVKSVMQNSGVAIMGTGFAEGDNRAEKAAEMALTSPLLNDNDINGADNILLYISSGSEEITLDEVTEITDYIQKESGHEAEIIWGNGTDDSLGNKICVTLIATGFDASNEFGYIQATEKQKSNKILYNLDSEEDTFKKSNINSSEEFEIINTEHIKENSDEKIESEDIQMFTVKTTSSKAEGTDKDDSSIDPVLIKNSKEETETSKENQEKESESNTIKAAPKIEDNDIAEKSLERIKRLRDMSYKLKTPEGLSEYENEPAFKRRNVELKDVKPSSESEISRYTLSENEEKKTEMKNNNSFLHDNVD
ncbi:cell division protein FtsZ [candidate division KSB1 bacterium]